MVVTLEKLVGENIYRFPQGYIDKFNHRLNGTPQRDIDCLEDITEIVGHNALGIFYLTHYAKFIKIMQAIHITCKAHIQYREVDFMTVLIHSCITPYIPNTIFDLINTDNVFIWQREILLVSPLITDMRLRTRLTLLGITIYEIAKPESYQKY